MDRYEELFRNLKAKNEGAFVPYVVIGDPTMNVSFKIIEAMIEGGADALELGIPFSDPVADGPVIQASGQRALRNGATPESCFELLSEVRKRFSQIPIGLLVYANLVSVKGLDEFYSLSARSGVDSVLVADVPVFESAPYFRSGERYNVKTVFIVPPNATANQLRGIARISTGYTYVLARSGVTGALKTLGEQRKEVFLQLEALGAPPALVGFGISKPEHVRATLEAGAAGAISGSAVVKIVEDNLEDAETMCAEVASFVRKMKDATRS